MIDIDWNILLSSDLHVDYSESSDTMPDFRVFGKDLQQGLIPHIENFDVESTISQRVSRFSLFACWDVGKIREHIWSIFLSSITDPLLGYWSLNPLIRMLGAQDLGYVPTDCRIDEPWERMLGALAEKGHSFEWSLLQFITVRWKLSRLLQTKWLLGVSDSSPQIPQWVSSRIWIVPQTSMLDLAVL